MTDPINLRKAIEDMDVPPWKAHNVEEVMDTTTMRERYEVIGFLAPYVVVRRKADGMKGSLMFTHNPRTYFGFEEDR